MVEKRTSQTGFDWMFFDPLAGYLRWGCRTLDLHSWISETGRGEITAVPFPDSGAILRAAFAHPLPPQTLVLCESVTSVEQAFKVLDLIVKHLENKAVIGGEIDDCECRIGDHVLANHLSFIHALIDCLRVLIGLK